MCRTPLHPGDPDPRSGLLGEIRWCGYLDETLTKRLHASAIRDPRCVASCERIAFRDMEGEHLASRMAHVGDGNLTRNVPRSHLKGEASRVKRRSGGDLSQAVSPGLLRHEACFFWGPPRRSEA